MILGICFSREINQSCDIHVAIPIFPSDVLRSDKVFYPINYQRRPRFFFENHEKSKLMQQMGQLSPNYDQFAVPARC